MQAIQAAPRLALDNILFATDFSTASERALHVAIALADWYGSRLLVAHAVNPEPHYNVPLEPLPVELDPVWQAARDKIAALESGHALDVVAHETILEHGQPWNVVSRILRQHKIDMLIAGTHGRTGLKRVVLGSQAETIFRQASCPVLTVGPHVDANENQRWNPKTVIFATDFSPASLHALPTALSIAEETESTLIVLHVTMMFPADQAGELQETTIARMKALLPPDAQLWCKPEFVLCCEMPADGILQVAEERGADLIVLGVRRKAMPVAASHMPWATASEVASRAPCPVLTVRG
jgi:nucleotide-binding universal stress UspA family protein